MRKSSKMPPRDCPGRLPSTPPRATHALTEDGRTPSGARRSSRFHKRGIAVSKLKPCEDPARQPFHQSSSALLLSSLQHDQSEN